MNYFEGYFDYHRLDNLKKKKKHKYRRVYFCEGAFRQQILHRNQTLQGGQYYLYLPNDHTLYYSLERKKKVNVLAFERINQTLKEAKVEGKETINGQECQKIKATVENWQEGDHDRWLTQIDFWCCPAFPLQETWHHTHLPFLNFPGICKPYCLALQYCIYDEDSDNRYIYTIDELVSEPLEDSLFTLPNNYHFDQAGLVEGDLFNNEAHLKTVIQEEEERVQNAQLLKEYLGRELTKAESRNPLTIYNQLKGRVALEYALGRPLNHEEFIDPMAQFMKVYGQIETEEQQQAFMDKFRVKFMGK